MIRALKLLCAAVLLAGSCACSVQLEGRRVDASNRTAPGIRYSLPKPILAVYPKADGTIATKVEFLPDEAQTYTIQARSTLAKHLLEVKVERGLLQKVVFKPDATPFASQLVTSGTAAAKTRIEAAETKREARREEDRTAQEARDKERATLEAAVTSARMELRSLRAELQAFELGGGTPDEIRRKRVAIARAEVALGFAEDALRQFEARHRALGPNAPASGVPPGGASFAGAGPDEDRGDEAWKQSGRLYARGPVFYEIVDNTSGRIQDLPRGVHLRAVEWRGTRGGESFPLGGQPALETSVPPPEARPKPTVRAADGRDFRVPSRHRIGAARLAVGRLQVLHEKLKAIEGTDLAAKRLEVAIQLAQAQAVLEEARAYRFRLVSDTPLLSASVRSLEGTQGKIEDVLDGAGLTATLVSPTEIVVDLRSAPEAWETRYVSLYTAVVAYTYRLAGGDIGAGETSVRFWVAGKGGKPSGGGRR